MKEYCKKQQKKNKTERRKGSRSYSEKMRAKWFCCAFKLGFLQLICKASLIFNSNLELALLNILNQRELYDSMHVVVECRSLKYETCYPFDMLLNTGSKMTASFANIARTTSASKFIY